MKLARQWLLTSVSDNDKAAFSSSIHGRAVADCDYVCVFDTKKRSKEFHLTLNSDLHTTQSWDFTKRIDRLADKLDGERQRIRDLQHEIFDKSPPTATLFYHEGWAMECEIPLPVLDQLSSDLVARCADSVRIQIEWPFGFLDNESGAWGFFEGSQLRGYVSRFAWLLLTDGQPMQSPA